MITPCGAPNFREAFRYAVETYHSLKSVLKAKGQYTAVGDEGGFAPNLSSNEEAVELIIAGIEKAGYKPGKDIAIALDPAASEFYEDGKYVLKADNSKLSSEEMVDYYAKLVSKYPIISIEDGLAENDWEGWKILTKELGEKGRHRPVRSRHATGLVSRLPAAPRGSPGVPDSRFEHLRGQSLRRRGPRPSSPGRVPQRNRRRDA